MMVLRLHKVQTANVGLLVLVVCFDFIAAAAACCHQYAEI